MQEVGVFSLLSAPFFNGSFLTCGGAFVSLLDEGNEDCVLL